MVLLGDVGQAEAHFDPFGDSFNPVQDRVPDLLRMYHHMEILLGTPVGTPR
jgi:hypothetical protein